MKASWKGSISFGMVYFPVNVYTATSGADGVRLNYLHKKCNHRIRYKKYCEVCNEEVQQDDIVKGYEYEKDKYVVLTNEDLEKLPINSKKTISVMHFVEEDKIDPVYLDKAYYISPGNPGAAKAFELFKRAMRDAGKVGIAKITLTSNEYVSVIMPYDKGGMLLHLLYYPDEIRKAENISELNYKADIHDNEMKMAISLIDNMTSEFNIEDYKNEYRDALRDLIQAKIEGKEVTGPTEVRSNVIDLMEALKASVEATKGNKAGAGARGTAMKRAAREGEARGSAARKKAAGKER
ncbi:MAG: Ku protein [Acetivibrionales bacterium]